MTTEQTVETTSPVRQETDTEQFLTFTLADSEYGVDILKVQEIKCWDQTTEIPNAPAFVQGVMNLRGAIVPVVDLRIRFNIEDAEYNRTTVVIVLKVESNDGERTMGFVVDAVSDVCNVIREDIKSTPDFGNVVDTAFVKGLATVDEKMVILLDIDLLVCDMVPGSNKAQEH